MCFIPKRFIWFVLIFFPAPNFSAFSILIYRNWKFIITSISVIFRLNSKYTWIGKNQNRISLMSHRSSQESSQYMQWLHLDKLFFFEIIKHAPIWLTLTNLYSKIFSLNLSFYINIPGTIPSGQLPATPSSTFLSRSSVATAIVVVSLMIDLAIAAPQISKTHKNTVENRAIYLCGKKLMLFQHQVQIHWERNWRKSSNLSIK